MRQEHFHVLIVFTVNSWNFISAIIENLDSSMYGGCSLTVELKTVALRVRVQFPASTLKIFKLENGGNCNGNC